MCPYVRTHSKDYGADELIQFRIRDQALPVLHWRQMEIAVTRKSAWESLKPLLTMVARNVDHRRGLIKPAKISHVEVAEQIDAFAAGDPPEREEDLCCRGPMRPCCVLRARLNGDDGLMVLGSADSIQ